MYTPYESAIKRIKFLNKHIKETFPNNLDGTYSFHRLLSEDKPSSMRPHHRYTDCYRFSNIPHAHALQGGTTLAAHTSTRPAVQEPICNSQSPQGRPYSSEARPRRYLGRRS